MYLGNRPIHEGPSTLDGVHLWRPESAQESLGGLLTRLFHLKLARWGKDRGDETPGPTAGKRWLGGTRWLDG